MILAPLTKVPTTSTSEAKVPTERHSYSASFAENLQTVAKHVNIMDVENGKAAVAQAAEFCLENSPAFLNRVRTNLEKINTKENLQKYVYNCILCGSKLYVR